MRPPSLIMLRAICVVVVWVFTLRRFPAALR